MRTTAASTTRSPVPACWPTSGADLPLDRQALRRALLAAEPWLAATDRGPQAVDAGSCDRCGVHPRLLPTCGPDGYPGLCRRCAAELGPAAWCDGHQLEATDLLTWADGLPDHADTVVTLWWVATGELRTAPDDRVGRDARLAADVRAALGAG